MTIDKLNPISECPISFNTGVAYDDAKHRSEQLAHFINTVRPRIGFDTNITLSSTDPVLDDLIYKHKVSEIVAPYYPVVMMVSSVGRTGKDTFIEKVSNQLTFKAATVSTVDEVKCAVYDLMNNLHKSYDDIFTDPSMKKHNPIEKATSIIDAKDEPYRQFLHDVKDSWTHFNNGPVLYCMATVLKSIKQSLEVSPQYTISIVFVNNRDKDTYDLMKHWCYSMGLMCIGIKVDGRLQATDYTNDCDSNVDDIDYDIVVTNKGTLGELNMKAWYFARLFENGICKYGIPLPKNTSFASLMHCDDEQKDPLDKFRC